MDSDSFRRIIPKRTLTLSVTIVALSLFAFPLSGLRPALAAPTTTGLIAQAPGSSVDYIGTVSVSTLPSAMGPGVGATPRLPALQLPSAKARTTVADPAFSISNVPPGSSFINVAKSLEGTPGYNPNPCLCAPSDMGLGASSQFVFQMVNLAGIVYTTSGAIAKPAFSLEDFWFAEPTRMSDPQVLYDAQGGRWFASILVLPNHVRFAVSANSDPTGIWYIYQVSAFGPGPTTLPDQPFIGYSNDKFLISTNNFSCDPTLTICVFFSVEIWVFNKAQMMAGAFAPAFNAFFNPGGLFFRVDPMQQLTPGNDAFLVWNCESISTNVCPFTPPTGGITVFTFSGPPPPTVVFPSIVTVPIALTGTPNNADQPGTTTKLNTNDERIISAVWSNNRIWTALNDGPFLNGGQCPVASCVRLDQIATPTTPASKLQDFDFYSNGAAAFYGAVSTDSSNNLVAMFETSSSTVFPSLLVTAQLATMTPQTLAPSSTVKAGSAVDMTGRWGDYYYATTQPGAPSTFWISGGYRTITLFQGWQTRIGQITFAAGGPSPPPPPPCPESDGNGNFQGNNGQGNFAFDNDKCEDGDTNSVSSSNRGDGQSFQSTQITSTQFDQATHATSITGIGVSNGVVVGFTLVALESSLTTPGWVSFSFSDGYTNAGYLTSGTILLH